MNRAGHVTGDYEQIALQPTGHARAVAADVRRRAERLPADSGAGRSPMAENGSTFEFDEADRVERQR